MVALTNLLKTLRKNFLLNILPSGKHILQLSEKFSKEMLYQSQEVKFYGQVLLCPQCIKERLGWSTVQ